MGWWFGSSEGTKKEEKGQQGEAHGTLKNIFISPVKGTVSETYSAQVEPGGIRVDRFFTARKPDEVPERDLLAIDKESGHIPGSQNEQLVIEGVNIRDKPKGSKVIICPGDARFKSTQVIGNRKKFAQSLNEKYGACVMMTLQNQRNCDGTVTDGSKGSFLTVDDHSKGEITVGDKVIIVPMTPSA